MQDSDTRRSGWPKRLLVPELAVTVVAGAVALRSRPRTPLPHFAGPTVNVIAHAGAQAHAPGDTLPAFSQAVEMGADALEMDVQLSADGQVVLMHDATVDRTTDGTGRVADHTLAELRALDAGYAFCAPDGTRPYRGKGVQIPTLDEVFAALPDTFMVIELKRAAGPALVPAVLATIERWQRADRVVVASFETAYLQTIRRCAPHVPTGFGEREVRTFHILQLLGLHRWWRPQGVVLQVPETADGRRVITPRFLRAARRLGLPVQVWTVNDPAAMRRLIDLGVSGLITDVPDELTALLASPVHG